MTEIIFQLAATYSSVQRAFLSTHWTTACNHDPAFVRMQCECKQMVCLVPWPCWAHMFKLCRVFGCELNNTALIVRLTERVLWRFTFGRKEDGLSAHHASTDSVTIRRHVVFMSVGIGGNWQRSITKPIFPWLYLFLASSPNNPPITPTNELAIAWTVRGSNPGVRIFRIRADRLCGPPSLLYNGYRVFPGGKADGAWRW